jgi:hypothetical protein
MIPLVVLAACTSPTRQARSLEGIWLATDTEVHRGLVVEEREAGEVGHPYTLYVYDLDAPPEPVQSGLLTVLEGEVLYDVRWDVDPFNVGLRFAAQLEREGRRAITLDGRPYERVDALPGPPPRVVGFGEAVHVVATATDGRGFTVLDDGTIWAVSTFVSVASAVGMGPDGEALDAGRRDELLSSGTFVSDGADLGVLTDQARLQRQRVERIPADQAGLSDDFAFPPVWTSAFRCFHLDETPTVWVATCENDGTFPTDDSEALVWIDPVDGRVIQAVGLDAPSGVWALGDDVLVRSRGASPEPDVHGDRGEDGSLLQRFDATGSLVASWWSPRDLQVTDAAAVGDLTILSLWTGSALAGAEDASGEPSAQLLGLDPAGVRWSRDLPRQPRLAYPRLLPVEGGVGLAMGATDLDLGLGALTPSHGRGEVLALLTMDACGEVVEQVAWEDCTTGSCAGTRTTGAPIASPWDLGRDPDGRWVLQAGLTGAFDLGGEVVGRADEGSGFLARLGPPGTVPACSTANHVPAEPAITVAITGEGTVTLGDAVCTETCTVPFPRFAEVPIDVTPADGGQISSIGGVCDTPSCTFHADVPSATLEVVFDQPDGTLIPSSGDVRRLAAGDTQVFAAGWFTSSLTATLDGQVVAPGSGQNAFLAVLDDSGLVGSVALAGTPVTADLVADGDVGVALDQDGTVRRFDATGLLSTTTAPAGPTYRRVAVDPTGTAAVLGDSSGELNVAAADGTWTVDVGISGLNQALGLVPRAAGGFTAVGFLGGTATLPDTTVVTGSPGDLLLLDVSATGVVGTAVAMPYLGGVGAELQVWETAGQLVFVTTVTRDPTAPSGDLFLDRVDATGAFVSTTPFTHADRAWPTAAGHVTAGSLYGPTNPWGGPDLAHRGSDDLLLGWWAGGTPGAASMGHVGSDGAGFPAPVAVLPDGTVFAHTAVDAAVASTHAVGVFTPP